MLQLIFIARSGNSIQITVSFFSIMHCCPTQNIPISSGMNNHKVTADRDTVLDDQISELHSLVHPDVGIGNDKNFKSDQLFSSQSRGLLSMIRHQNTLDSDPNIIRT